MYSCTVLTIDLGCDSPKRKGGLMAPLSPPAVEVNQVNFQVERRRPRQQQAPKLLEPIR